MANNSFPQRQQFAGTFPTTAPVAPMMGAPFAPGFAGPGAPFAPGFPGAVAPFGAGPVAPLAAAPTFPPGTPVAAAPVRRIVHPTRVMETHTATRIPIVNVYPTHTRRVHHNVYEYYCEYPHSESNQCCDHQVDCCCAMPRRPMC